MEAVSNQLLAVSCLVAFLRLIKLLQNIQLLIKQMIEKVKCSGQYCQESC
jgi:hypothetical protein